MRKLADINVLEDGETQERIVRDSIVVLVVGLVLSLVRGALGPSEGWRSLIDLTWWGALFLAYAVSLPVHELVHAAAFTLLVPGHRVRFGHTDWMLYAGCPGALIPRRRMLVVLLAPTVVVTAALLMGTAACGRPVLGWLLATLHLSGCVGDWLMVRAIVGTPACTHVEDTDFGVTLLADDDADPGACSGLASSPK